MPDYTMYEDEYDMLLELDDREERKARRRVLEQRALESQRSLDAMLDSPTNPPIKVYLKRGK